MNTMNHGGYTARIEFDERDSIFVGRILGLRSIISFHGKTVTQLRREFAAAVKEYLRDCEERERQFLPPSLSAAPPSG